MAASTSTTAICAWCCWSACGIRSRPTACAKWPPIFKQAEYAEGRHCVAVYQQETEYGIVEQAAHMGITLIPVRRAGYAEDAIADFGSRRRRRSRGGIACPDPRLRSTGGGADPGGRRAPLPGRCSKPKR
ncbi:MAG: hypothetical protein WDN04_17085 [Rhodospirillales bacterium]